MRWGCSFFIVLCLSTAQAQLFTDNGEAITMESGAQITIEGGFQANAGSYLDCSGGIDLTGDWIDNSGGGLMGPSGNDIIFHGTTQIIGGTSTTRFFDLTLLCNNLQLQQDTWTGGWSALPTGTLSLNNTIVQLNGHRITVNYAAPTAITRITGQLVSETDALTGYGEVEWRMGTNTGNYVVPFGDGSSYLPLSLNISAPGVGAGAFVFATYPTDPFASPNNRPLPTGLAVLMDMTGMENAPNVLDRFWPITTVGFTASPSASLTFTYKDSEWNTGNNTIAEGTLQAQRFDGAQWSLPNGVANTVSNIVSTTPVNAFDQVWSLSSASTPLPVELLSFDARPEGSYVLCAWSTASEQNNDFFTVERSRDGEHFENIGEVGGAGSTQQALAYSFTDEAPYSGLSYYRLRQTDLDGTESVSQIVAVVFSGEENPPLIVWPNPCHTALHLSGTEASADIHIMDATGRTLVSRMNTSNVIDVSALAAGTYTLMVQQNDALRSIRFVKQ